jgi:hypothetical protein
MSSRTNKITKLFVLIGSASAMALGCELIVDFDRTKIPVEASDANVTDSAVGDAPVDTGSEAAVDSGQDAGQDAPDDAADAADAPDAD